MRKFFSAQVISTGLAIFSMFFGAGNLMFPIKVGLVAGDATPFALAGFLITAVILPTVGLASMILFDGNYTAFFGRLGRIPGAILIFISMLVLGPAIAMPRIVTLSYTMISPFIPVMPLIVFSILFLLLTFFAAYKESKIINVLGNIISPTLIIALAIIIIKGFLAKEYITETGLSGVSLFFENLKYGYNTLDVLGGIFFASILLNILKKNVKTVTKNTHAELAALTFKAGVIGSALLAIVYVGLSFLGAYFGHGLTDVNEGELFSAISFRILGSHAAIIISVAVLMACFSTIIALAAVFAEYLQNTLAKNKISYVQALIATLIATFIPSFFGLGAILKFSIPIILICYPAIIVLMILNLAYKLWGFTPVKIPVFVTLACSCISYFFL